MRIERLDYQAQLAQRRYEQVDPSSSSSGRYLGATLEPSPKKKPSDLRTITRSIASNRDLN